MYGNVQQIPQSEKTDFYPLSPYGVAKLYGHWITKNYREAYNLYACSGILFNHESPRRNINFISRKISSSLALILKKKLKKINLGNINAQRDWGHAKDYVYAMWKMLQLKKPHDIVIGTGKTHTVKDFLRIAFSSVNLDYRKYIKIETIITKMRIYIIKKFKKLFRSIKYK